MLTWFVYDIVEDVARRKIADKAIALGLYRVQKSVFLGNIEETTADELLLYSEEMMDQDEDSVYMFPMCQEDFKKVELRGEIFNKDKVNDELKTLVL
ncbi:CRISPR-associated endonuclease Cas2 [Halanaerobaculum tunisiense]